MGSLSVKMEQCDRCKNTFPANEEGHVLGYAVRLSFGVYLTKGHRSLGIEADVFIGSGQNPTDEAREVKDMPPLPNVNQEVVDAGKEIQQIGWDDLCPHCATVVQNHMNAILMPDSALGIQFPAAISRKAKGSRRQSAPADEGQKPARTRKTRSDKGTTRPPKTAPAAPTGVRAEETGTKPPNGTQGADGGLTVSLGGEGAADGSEKDRAEAGKT